MSKIMKYLVAGFVMVAFLLPLRQDANAGVSEWMKNHPKKAWNYYKDQSYLYFWVYNTHRNWSSLYYYRKDFKPAYTVDEKEYQLRWYTSTRWGPQYSSNLAYASFNMYYYPKQKRYDLYWGDQHDKEYYYAELTTYWKIVSRWALGVYLKTYRYRQMYDSDYMESVRYGDYQTVTADSKHPYTYRHKIDDEDYFYNTSVGTKGYHAYYPYETSYYKVGLGLKWYGKAYYGYTYNPKYYAKCGAYPDRPEVEAPE